LIVQRSVLGDINNEPLKLNWKTIMATWSSIPNLTATAQPVEAIKGRYLYEAAQYDTTLTPPERARKYEEALVLLDKGRVANPVVGYSEFLKAGVYFRLNKFDSAARNAWAAFEIRPKAKTYFQTLIAVLAKIKDTTGIKKAFAEYDHYRHWASGWNMYLLGMLNATGRGNTQLLAMADSALKMFPNELEAKDVAVRRNEILSSMAVTLPPGSKPVDYAAAQRWYAMGVAAFGSGNAATDSLAKAAKYFLKAAAISSNDYTTFENAAMCYFNLRDFARSLIYFDKALALKTSTNGKAEFFKGVALINLGKAGEGCTFLHIAKAKNYKEKEAELTAILKSRCGEK
jgi:tetratricopeptide (TPR) repeat protein